MKVRYRTVPYLPAGASALGTLDSTSTSTSTSSRWCEALDWRWNDTMSMCICTCPSTARSLRLGTPLLSTGWNGTANSKQQTARGHQLELTAAVVVNLHFASYILEMAVPDHGSRNGSHSSAE